MRRDMQIYRLVKRIKKEGINISYIVLYNTIGRICVDNRIILTLERNEPNKTYYRVLRNIGIRYQRIEKVGDLKIIDRAINLLDISFLDSFLSNVAFIYLDKGYKVDLRRIEDIFPFATYEQKEPKSELLIRYTYRCNQNCEFCSAPPPIPDPPEEYLKLLIRRATVENIDFDITFTGGEPAVRKGFEKIVKWTLKNIDSNIRIQTNAVAFSSKKFVDLFPRSNRLSFFVSLHSLTEKEYNTITSSKGMLKKATDGITNILRRGYFTIINIVLNRYNYKNMDSYFNEYFNLFGRYKPPIHISVLILPPHRMGLEKYIVSYKEILGHILPILERYNIPLSSLASSTHASIPLCFFPEKYRHQLCNNKYTVSPYETGYEATEKPWVKKYECQRCIYDRYCLGVPTLYYNIYGLDNK